MAAAVLYTGITLFLRWRENRSNAERAVQAEAEADRKIVDQFGGGQMKVLMFYANPPVIRRGSTGLLCYGVASAKSVRIDPGVESIAPSLSRCVEIRPSKDTTYTLTASDVRGRVETRTVAVSVQ